MRYALATLLLVAALGLAACVSVQRMAVIWKGDTVNVTPTAAAQIGEDAAALLDTHYARNTTFQVVSTEKNAVSDAIITHLLGMGYGVDLLYRDENAQKAKWKPSEVRMTLQADDLGFNDIVRVEVHVDRVTATRIYTSVSGTATGPWTVTSVPKGVVSVVPASPDAR
jgi:hypothetical protein